MDAAAGSRLHRPVRRGRAGGERIDRPALLPRPAQGAREPAQELDDLDAALDEREEGARPVLKDLQAGLGKQPNKYIVRVSNKAVNDLLGTDNKVP